MGFIKNELCIKEKEKEQTINKKMPKVSNKEERKIGVLTPSLKTLSIIFFL